MKNINPKKLLFIGHSYHKKTRSCDFMVELLRMEYDVELVYISPYEDLDLSCLENYRNQHFDVLVVWQIYLPVKQISNILLFKSGIYFPMFDQMLWSSPYDLIWSNYRDFHIISFSSTLYKILKPHKYDIHYVQYSIPPRDISGDYDLHTVFLWHRRKEIGLNILKALSENYRIDHVYIHEAPDPDTDKIQIEDFPAGLRKQCEISEWFPEKNMLYEKMAKAAIYIAPRQYEGIGMSFLEAMAMGCCVIAPDFPTMNEYITHGENGILYDLDNPSFHFTEDNVIKIQKNVKSFMNEKMNEWENDKKEILSIIRTPNKKMPPFPFLLLVHLKTLKDKLQIFCYKTKLRLRKYLQKRHE